MRNFKKLNVWQKSMALVVSTYSLTKKLPDSEKYGLISQVNRCSVSILSNIAEGSSRSTKKDYAHFLRMAIGSCFELETQAMIIEMLEFVETDELSKIKSEIDEVQKMLFGLLKALNSSRS